MAHWRSMFPNEKYIGSWDLDGKDQVAVTIDRLTVEEMRDTSGAEVQKPVLHFKEAKKGMVLNKTNAKTIAELHGNDVDQWEGKMIALFATTCQAFGKTTACIRVSNREPAGATYYAAE